MLWIFIVPAVVLGLLSLRGERARLRYVLERIRIPNGREWPAVTVIVPVKGGDEGIDQNLRALALLDYPDYELIVTARAESDLPRTAIPARARVVLSGTSDPDTGEKIQNLLAAVREARPESRVFAFADSDGRVPASWLKALVEALSEPHAGASTGYRWHFPDPADFWSLLRSVWNAVIAGGFGPGANNFAWGGAMAMRRELFVSLRVQDYWRGAISDDYRLSEAVKDAGLRIIYAPAAMVAGVDHTGGREFLQWIRRQMTITRFYAPRLWRVALIAHVIYCVAMAGAAWLAAHGNAIALAALLFQLGLGMWKGSRRVNLARLTMPGYRKWLDRYGWLHVLLVPVGTWLWLYSCISSALSDTVEWRGYRHRMRRPR